MPLIMRYKLTWALPSGGPGVTTLFAFPDTTEQVFADGARAFMSDALQVATAHDALPTGCSIQGDSIVDNIEVTDGTLASAVPVTAPVVINGNATGSYSAPSGAVITWLTGYDESELERNLAAETNFADFFAGARLNPNATLITGVICGVRGEAIEDPLMQQIRYLDKLVDELAKGRALEKVLRT